MRGMALDVLCPWNVYREDQLNQGHNDNFSTKASMTQIVFSDNVVRRNASVGCWSLVCHN